MTAQEFIEHKLEGIQPAKQRPESNLADFIYARILSKKFRKYSVNPVVHNTVREAIRLNMEKDEPIKIALPFGSYKIWRLPESPEPDWSELFAMIYYADWLTPIANAYKPGVWFDFCGDDAILKLMNNIPEADTAAYKRSFRNLLQFMRPFLPENFRYTFSPVGERYGSKEEFLNDLNKNLAEQELKGEILLSERELEMMRFNIRADEGEVIDFQKNRRLHDAYMAVSKRRPHHKAPDKILISATPFGDRTSIPLGTTKTSVVKFQTGTGVLKRSGAGFQEYIYSPSQLSAAKFCYEPVHLEGLGDKNFNQIRIIS